MGPPPDGTHTAPGGLVAGLRAVPADGASDEKAIAETLGPRSFDPTPAAIGDILRSNVGPAAADEHEVTHGCA